MAATKKNINFDEVLNSFLRIEQHAEVPGAVDLLKEELNEERKILFNFGSKAMNAQEGKMAREVLDLVEELDEFVGKADDFLADWRKLCAKLDQLKHKFPHGEKSPKPQIIHPVGGIPGDPIKPPKSTRTSNPGDFVQSAADCPKEYIPTIGTFFVMGLLELERRGKLSDKDVEELQVQKLKKQLGISSSFPIILDAPENYGKKGLFLDTQNGNKMRYNMRYKLEHNGKQYYISSQCYDHHRKEIEEFFKKRGLTKKEIFNICYANKVQKSRAGK